MNPRRCLWNPENTQISGEAPWLAPASSAASGCSTTTLSRLRANSDTRAYRAGASSVRQTPSGNSLRPSADLDKRLLARAFSGTRPSESARGMTRRLRAGMLLDFLDLQGRCDLRGKMRQCRRGMTLGLRPSLRAPATPVRCAVHLRARRTPRSAAKLHGSPQLRPLHLVVLRRPLPIHHSRW